MLVFKIALIGIAGAILAMVTKQFKPEYSTLVLFALCLFLVGYLTLWFGRGFKFCADSAEENPNQYNIYQNFI